MKLNQGERLFQGEVGVVNATLVQGEDYVDLYKTGSGDDEDVWIRELVTYNNTQEASDHLDIDEEDLNETGVTGDFVVIDSDALESGAHHLNSSSGQMSFDIRVQSLTTEWDDETITNVGGETTLDIDSNRAQFQAGISADGLDHNDLMEIFNESVFAHSEDEDIVYVNATGSFNANFDDVDPGTYDFTVHATDTTAEDTASIEVLDEEISYDFGKINTTGQGDVANLTMSLENADKAALQVGVWDDFFYEVGLNITADEDYDGEEFAIQMNTYTAGGGGINEELNNTDSDDLVFSTDHDDISIDVVYRMIGADQNLSPMFFGPTDAVDTGSQFQGLLAQGSHELLLGAEWNMSTINASATDPEFADSAEDTTFLTITEASEPGAFTVNAAAANEDIVGEDNLEEATISQADSIANGDSMVAIVEDFGMEGMVDYIVENRSLSNGDNIGKAFAEAANVTFQIKPDDLPPTADHAWNTSGPEPGKALPGNLRAYALNVDDYDGDLMVELDYGKIFTDDEERGLDVTFAADSNIAFSELDGENENLRQSQHIELEEAWVEFDPETAQVPNSEEAEVSGTTNLAPGSEIRVRAYSAGAFTENIDATVEVDDDGNWAWSTIMDLSAGTPGSSFTLDVSGPHGVESEMEPTLTQAGEVQPASFQISTDVPSSVAPGDDASLSVTVTNVGDEEGDSNYTVMVDGEEVDSQMLTLASGGENMSEYTLDTAEEGTIEWEVMTDDDSASGSVEVATPDEPSDGGDDGNQTDGGDDGGDDEGEGDGTPGFGIAIAIVALLGAAMLALRRQN
ncbi:MAG: BGTF surface domain-containing protein [Natrialbaceae archaeon]|nr:BGTF surface domain-containing protein [Natrialbaceae archaeon]